MTIQTIESKIDDLPNSEYLSQYSGTWALSEKAGDIQNEIQQLTGQTAWKNLGNLYSKILSFLPKGKDGAWAFGASSRDFLSYWSIRAYLIAGEEEKAIEQLKNAKHLENVINTLRNTSGKLKETPKKVKGEDFNLPDLKNYSKFYKYFQRTK